MRVEIFNSSALGLKVFREENGSLGWEGTYKGVPIKDVIPVDGECIILLAYEASKQLVFKNLFRVGQDGDPRWVAELPDIPDAFVEMRLQEDSLVAGTWSGYMLRIDPNSGRQLAQEFTK